MRSYSINVASSKTARPGRGAALTEGAAALLIIVPAAIGGLLLLSGSGMALYYKMKVSYAAMEGARYATQTSEWLGAPRPGWSDNMVTTVVNTSLRKMGLPDGHVVTKKEIIGGTRYYSVTVTVNGLRNIGLGSMPSISDTATSPFSVTSAPATLGLTFGDSGSVVLPCYGHGSGRVQEGPVSPERLTDTYGYFGGSVNGELGYEGNVPGKGFEQN